MTGKEALDYYTKTYKNPDNTIVPEKEWLFDVIRDDLELLDKYKRAFEILNLNFTLICKEDEYLCNKEYYLLSDTYTKIEKEEAELLEELMKGE